MKKLVGAAVAAAWTAVSAIGIAQPFETCVDARNYGQNISEVAVGQVMARVNCNASMLPEAESSLVAALQNLVATWTGNADLKRCYYEGIYENAVERLQRDYARCSDPAFHAPSLETISRIAVATFVAMIDTGRGLVTTTNTKAVFDIDYGFLGVIDPRVCRQGVEAAEREVLGMEAPVYTRFLNIIEAQICEDR
ncbi:hypothetical protein [Polyangium sp. 6x1]|uniref:hypothetical protein n=1 Tax=Polyangium sp. 6x1 TaxID=3042689 RepID=UPI002482E5BC|nr:hypothetical protein [Polyangium sp. 6x1]MDI1451011.1 hypothetical protein [Polyangium sp. 6x1]